MIDIQNAKKVFKEYVSNYDINDGKIALKYNHILRVAEIAKKIATDLELSEEDILLAGSVLPRCLLQIAPFVLHRCSRLAGQSQNPRVEPVVFP